jgi:hypothetical protein
VALSFENKIYVGGTVLASHRRIEMNNYEPMFRYEKLLFVTFFNRNMDWCYIKDIFFVSLHCLGRWFIENKF